MARWWRILTRPRGGLSPAPHPPDRPASAHHASDRHLPGLAPIDAYGDGGFRFADMSHRGAILLLPKGIFALGATTPAGLSVDALARVLAEPEGLETFLIGTGQTLTPLLPEIAAAFRAAGIVAEVMTTGSAVRIYNIMLGEGRAVGAALLPVGEAK